MHLEMRINMFAFVLVIVCVILGALGQVSMKNGMNQIDKIHGIKELTNSKTILNIIGNKYVIVGLFLYFFAAFLWLAALSTLDVSFMYPLLSFAYVITAIGAFVFLGENVSVIRWAGIALVVVGCLLITRS